MPIRRILLAASLLLGLPFVAPADAAILIEAHKQGEAVRMVVDNQTGRALITTARGRALVDLVRNEVYLQNGSGPARKVRLDRAVRQTPDPLYRVSPWGPGPRIGGHATVYHVITYGDEICAEMLVSGWMKEFVQPVVRAIDLLEGLQTPRRGEGCGRIPFGIYAAAGWPIMAGKIDHLTFETSTIRFDYQPRERELVLPVSYEEVGPDRVIREAMAPLP